MTDRQTQQRAVLDQVRELATLAPGEQRRCAGEGAAGGCDRRGVMRSKAGKWYCVEHDPHAPEPAHHPQTGENP
jgi:hypothetical protein